MKKSEIVKILKKTIYLRHGTNVVSISTLKHAINLIANKHIYCINSTYCSKLNKEYPQIRAKCCCRDKHNYWKHYKVKKVVDK